MVGKTVRHAQPAHHCIPLPSVGVQGAPKEQLVQRQIAVQGLQEEESSFVLHAVLSPGEARRLRVPDMHVCNSVAAHSVPWQHQVTATQIQTQWDVARK